MPLERGSSKKVVPRNIKREMSTGKPQKQAVAIALNTARKRAMGGALPPIAGMGLANGLAGPPGGFAGMGAAMPGQGGQGLSPPMQGVPNPGLPQQMPGPQGVAGFAFGGAPGIGAKKRPTAPHMTKGSILSAVPGRTDAHATHVPSGSYVIPADIVSGRGQGNTLAGSQALEKLFKMGPYGTKGGTLRSGKGAPGRPGKRAAGGEVGGEEVPVRVNLAGGEIVVPPENLLGAVHPDLKTAHAIMDRWVLNERKNLRKTLAKLPGPAKGNE